ncbi:MAG: Holliday junction resolvase RuvX [Candidatus Berkelbacteria bacterium]
MYLAIDYGKKRIGLAIGEKMARGFGVLENSPEVIDEIVEKCRAEQIEKIIIGLPKREDGTDGGMGAQIRSFAALLERSASLPVIFEEESFTSVEAERLLGENGVDISKDKAKVDELSAVLILEQYINAENR